jgi:hypothetical protein
LQNNHRHEGPDGRAAARTNLFMAATLRTAGAEIPVKIRDLSATGAQIETAVLPDIGAAISLVRGRLSVHGRVTWCMDRRCGLHFSARVSVPEWMANPVNREQRRVDHVVAAVKAGVAPRPAATDQRSKARPGFAEDLTHVAQLLDSLGEALASDPKLVERHGVALQNLDIAMQTLAALAETIKTGAPEDMASIARLNELRISCAQALQA